MRVCLGTVHHDLWSIAPAARGSKPSGQIVSFLYSAPQNLASMGRLWSGKRLKRAHLRSAFRRFALEKSAKYRYESVSVALYKLAVLKFAPLRLAPRKSASRRFEPLRSAPKRLALRRQAPRRLAWLKSAPCKSALIRLSPCRLARISFRAFAVISRTWSRVNLAIDDTLLTGQEADGRYNNKSERSRRAGMLPVCFAHFVSL